MRQTLVFMRNSAIRGTLIPIFQQFTASIKKKKLVWKKDWARG